MGSNKVELAGEGIADLVEPSRATPSAPESPRPTRRTGLTRSAAKQVNCGIDLAAVQAVISPRVRALNSVCLFDEKTRKITDGSGMNRR